MSIIWKTEITDVGPEVADLAAGGVVIFFADGAPPELAEVSVLHRQSHLAPAEDPVPGARMRIGALEARITAVGEKAWDKVREIGHVVVTFNGAATAERPGEICASVVDTDELAAALVMGAGIAIEA